MDLSNPRYKNQGLHIDIAIFTVINKEVKVLLVRRANKPNIGQWMLPGGGVYNDESIDFAAARELAAKTGIKNVYLEQVYAFGDPKRDPRLRLASIAYLALVDSERITVFKKTEKILDSRWFKINKIPHLLFDHNEILKHCIDRLRKRMISSNIAVDILSRYFTLPELQQLYETILDKKIDRRNFRKKFLSLDLLKKVNKIQKTGRRPADLYTFKQQKIQNIEIL